MFPNQSNFTTQQNQTSQPTQNPPSHASPPPDHQTAGGHQSSDSNHPPKILSQTNEFPLWKRHTWPKIPFPFFLFPKNNMSFFVDTSHISLCFATTANTSPNFHPHYLQIPNSSQPKPPFWTLRKLRPRLAPHHLTSHGCDDQIEMTSLVEKTNPNLPEAWKEISFRNKHSSKNPQTGFFDIFWIFVFCSRTCSCFHPSFWLASPSTYSTHRHPYAWNGYWHSRGVAPSHEMDSKRVLQLLVSSLWKSKKWDDVSENP